MKHRSPIPGAASCVCLPELADVPSFVQLSGCSNHDVTINVSVHIFCYSYIFFLIGQCKYHANIYVYMANTYKIPYERKSTLANITLIAHMKNPY